MNETVQIVLDCRDSLRQNREFVLNGFVVLESRVHRIAPAACPSSGPGRRWRIGGREGMGNDRQS